MAGKTSVIDATIFSLIKPTAISLLLSLRHRSTLLSHERHISSAMIALSRHSSTAKAAVPAVYRLFNITWSRFFSTAGAAAEAQLDPDYYYYYNEPHRRNPLGAMDDTENSVPGRGVQWAFIGSPRAKKRVYAETLSKLLEVPCISMASLARQELNPRSSLYKQVSKLIN